METVDMFKGFDYEQVLEAKKRFEDEVEKRWGKTEAYEISKIRTSAYTKEIWNTISAAEEENMKELVACFNEKIAANDSRIITLCGKARDHINKYYYPCSVEMFSNLGNMYANDERFTEYYDKNGKGLAEYYNKAIQNYCNLQA